MGDRQATRRRLPVAELEEYLHLNPELLECGVDLFFGQVGGNQGDEESAPGLVVDHHHPRRACAACDHHRCLFLILTVEPSLEPIHLGFEFLEQGIQRADVEFQVICVHLRAPVAQFGGLRYCGLVTNQGVVDIRRPAGGVARVFFDARLKHPCRVDRERERVRRAISSGKPAKWTGFEPRLNHPQ